MGSMMHDPNVLTLLSPTQETPGVLSVFPIFIHAFGKVSPWLLWIVIAQPSRRGSCCRSCKPFDAEVETVTGNIGTQEEKLSVNEGPL